MSIKRYQVTCFCIVAFLFGSLFTLAGCGEDKSSMQDFVNGYLTVFDTLQGNPEVAEEGRKASMQYAMSGYEDLDLAKKAQESFEVSNENDLKAMRELDGLSAPDSDAEEIIETLKKGTLKVGEGNEVFASKYEKAAGQSAEERKTEAEDIKEPMGLYVEGMTLIVESLESLKNYIEKNGLKGIEDAEKWHERIESELQMVKMYSK